MPRTASVSVPPSVPHDPVVRMSRRTPVLALALVVVALAVAACSDDPDPIRAGELSAINVRLAQAPGPESQVLTALYAEAYTAAGAVVEIDASASPDAALQAVAEGQADLALDFAGRLYSDVLGLEADAAEPPARIEVARAVADGLQPRGISALNRAPYNAVERVICSGEALRRANATNLSELAAAIRPVRYVTGTEQRSDDGDLARLARAYPGLFRDPDGVAPGDQFAAVRDGEADCALAPAGAPQISRFGLLALVDDKATQAPNQAIALANTEFVLSAPDAFVTLTNRITALITDERVRRWNSAVQLDGAEPADVAREALSGADVVG